MPLLEVTDLDKTFTVDNRSVIAIDHLSLSIDEHEFVSIVGPSAAARARSCTSSAASSPRPRATCGSTAVQSGLRVPIAA